MILFDGSNNKVLPNRNSVKTALLGNTSMVRNQADTLSIFYNEEIGEINIFQGDNETDTYDLDGIDDAIKLFLWKVQGEV